MTLKVETLTPSKTAKVAAMKDVALKAASNTVANTKVKRLLLRRPIRPCLLKQHRLLKEYLR